MNYKYRYKTKNNMDDIILVSAIPYGSTLTYDCTFRKREYQI